MSRTLKIRALTTTRDEPDRYVVCELGVGGDVVMETAMGYADAARRFLGVGVTTPIALELDDVAGWVTTTVDEALVEQYRLGWHPHVEPVQPTPADDLPLEEPVDHEHHDPATCAVCQAPGRRVLVPRYVCPVCKTATDAARCQTGDHVPEAGDLSVCSTCGDVSEFVFGLSRQPVDRAKLTDLVREDPSLKRLVKLAKGIRLGFLDRLTR